MADDRTLPAMADDRTLHARLQTDQLALMGRLHPDHAGWLGALEKGVFAGYHFPWRLAECPALIPRTLLARDAAAMRGIVDHHFGTHSVATLRATVPPRYRRPAGSAAAPRFIATDFQRVFDHATGTFTWCSPEVQSFPANVWLKPAMIAAYRHRDPALASLQQFPDARFADMAAYVAFLRERLVGTGPATDTVILEVRPLDQKTVVDMLLACRHLRCRLVDLLDTTVDAATGDVVYSRAIEFTGARPEVREYARPQAARRIISRCIPPEVDAVATDAGSGIDDTFLDGLLRGSIERRTAEWVVHPEDFFLLSKASLVDNPHHHPRLRVLDRALLAGLDAAGVDVSTGVIKPAALAGGQGIRGVSSRTPRAEIDALVAASTAARAAAVDASAALDHTWLWQPRYGADVFDRNAVPGVHASTADDAGGVYHELRLMWFNDVDPTNGASDFVLLTGMSRWSRLGAPANAGFQRTAFTGTNGILIGDD